MNPANPQTPPGELLAVTQADRDLLATILENAGVRDVEIGYVRHAVSKALSDECETALDEDLQLVARHRLAHAKEQAAGVDDRYLIRKGGYYYRPNAQGYTVSKSEAGRYTLEDAIRLTHPNGPDGPRDGLSYELDDTPPAPAPAPASPSDEGPICPQCSKPFPDERAPNIVLSCAICGRASSETDQLAPAPASSVGEGLPADVVRLVIAARMVAWEDPDPATLKELQDASELFADRVTWDDEPELRNLNVRSHGSCLRCAVVAALLDGLCAGCEREEDRLLARLDPDRARATPDRAPAPADLVEALEQIVAAVEDNDGARSRMMKMAGIAKKALAALRSPDDLAKGNATPEPATEALVGAARRVFDGLNARIDAAVAKGEPVPVFDGIADLHDALAALPKGGA